MLFEPLRLPNLWQIHNDDVAEVLDTKVMILNFWSRIVDAEHKYEFMTKNLTMEQISGVHVGILNQIWSLHLLLDWQSLRFASTWKYRATLAYTQIKSRPASWRTPSHLLSEIAHDIGVEESGFVPFNPSGICARVEAWARILVTTMRLVSAHMWQTRTLAARNKVNTVIIRSFIVVIQWFHIVVHFDLRRHTLNW